MNERQRRVIRRIIANLVEIRDDEQDKYDNAPEGLQDTDRVYAFQENADNLQEAIDILTDLVGD